jgi:predicted XRE-type DNA-binding protein
MTADTLTIQALRSDMALQLSRFVQSEGASQIVTAKRLGIPQPTLSKIIRGEVDSLSLELLIRIAVRAGLPFVLQTGSAPVEAGVYVTGRSIPQRSQRSALAEQAKESLSRSMFQLSPQERLDAHLQHCELLADLQQAATAATAAVPKRAAWHRVSS